MPRQSAFVRDRKGASASVFLQLKQGRRLEQEQIQAIVNLVASSIPDLEANQVTVVDQQGRLLSSPEGHDQFAIREQQYDMIHRLEDDYAQRIDRVNIIGNGRPWKDPTDRQMKTLMVLRADVDGFGALMPGSTYPASKAWVTTQEPGRERQGPASIDPVQAPRFHARRKEATHAVSM